MGIPGGQPPDGPCVAGIMTAMTDATLAANRFGLGVRPGELTQLGSVARGALLLQIKSPAPRITADLPPSHAVLA